MQAVILCAGKGSRMKEISEKIPKSLAFVHNKTLLEYKLNILPSCIDEVILVIGHKGNLIRDYFGDSYKNIPIRYVEDTTISGTAHALRHAKDILENRFLVMMGDDIYDARSVKEATNYDCSIVCKRALPQEKGSRIIKDAQGNLSDFVTETKYREMFPHDGGLVFTGLYSLTTEIFAYPPVKLKTVEEWGLPQTLLSAKEKLQPKIIETDFWLSISSPEDIKNAETILQQEKFTNDTLVNSSHLT